MEEFRRLQMTAKEKAIHVIDTLPGSASMEDVIHALYVKAKFEHGEDQIRKGKGVSHSDARKRLKKWLK
jgi:hypothetical protein